jgi:hypothetical protein
VRHLDLRAQRAPRRQARAQRADAGALELRVEPRAAPRPREAGQRPAARRGHVRGRRGRAYTRGGPAPPQYIRGAARPAAPGPGPVPVLLFRFPPRVFPGCHVLTIDADARLLRKLSLVSRAFWYAARAAERVHQAVNREGPLPWLQFAALPLIRPLRFPLRVFSGPHSRVSAGHIPSNVVSVDVDERFQRKDDGDVDVDERLLRKLSLVSTTFWFAARAVARVYLAENGTKPLLRFHTLRSEKLLALTAICVVNEAGRTESLWRALPGLFACLALEEPLWGALPGLFEKLDLEEPKKGPHRYICWFVSRKWN